MSAFWSPPPAVGSYDWSNIQRRSVVIAAQAYAGTTSTLRIVRQLADNGYKVIAPGDDMWIAGTPERSGEFAEYQEFNEIYFWRDVHACAESLSRSSVLPAAMRCIVTFRDPRDVLVSDFNNIAHDHEPPPEPQHQKAFLAKREHARQMGVDAHVLSRVIPIRRLFFDSLPEVQLLISPRRVVPLSYARLCLDFPGFLDDLISNLDLTPSTALLDHLLLTEDVRQREKMPSHSNCHFPRASPLPGRFRRELQPATIARLNAELADVLAWMRAADHPAFAHTYLP